MIRHLSIIAIFLFPLAAIGQNVNQIVVDEYAQEEYLYGISTIDAFQEPQFSSWYNAEYNDYQPDEQLVKQIIEDPTEFAVQIVLGTWCSDSRREVPRFIKLLSAISFPHQSIEIIGVDRSKVAPEAGVEEGYVDYVPTFIIFHNQKEIGRIIETPQKSLEKDLLEILSSKDQD